MPLANLLGASYPKARLGEMVLNDMLAEQIRRGIREQRHAGCIAEHGPSPGRKLLSTDPPGTRKTMTASFEAWPKSPGKRSELPEWTTDWSRRWSSKASPTSGWPSKALARERSGIEFFETNAITGARQIGGNRFRCSGL